VTVDGGTNGSVWLCLRASSVKGRDWSQSVSDPKSAKKLTTSRTLPCDYLGGGQRDITNFEKRKM